MKTFFKHTKLVLHVHLLSNVFFQLANLQQKDTNTRCFLHRRSAASSVLEWLNFCAFCYYAGQSNCESSTKWNAAMKLLNLKEQRANQGDSAPTNMRENKLLYVWRKKAFEHRNNETCNFILFCILDTGKAKSLLSKKTLCPTSKTEDIVL